MAATDQSCAADIVAIAATAAFGSPLITNVHRGLLVEAIIRRALPSEWHWCSGDYHAWDFERTDGLRLEVRQSASRQSWHTPNALPSRIAFDIAARTGRYGDNGTWIAQRRRWADLYIFAHHPVTDSTTDHRVPAQWRFYVVREEALPDQGTLALSRVRLLAQSVGFDAIAAAVVSVSEMAVPGHPFLLT